jgi:hypothetical protein
MPDVVHDADHGHLSGPRLASEREACANGVAIGPVQSRGGFIEDHNAGAFL